jgi:hypothetical protein
MRGHVITESEMHRAGELAAELTLIGIQYGIDHTELRDAISFLIRLKWKNQER